MNKLTTSPLTTGCWLHKSAGLLQLLSWVYNFFLFSCKGQPLNLSAMLEEKLEAISPDLWLSEHVRVLVFLS